MVTIPNSSPRRHSGRLPADLHEILRRQRGVVTGRQLRAHGLLQEEIEALRSRRTISRVDRDLYRLAGAPTDFETACLAVCVVHPHGAIGGASAAALWDFHHVHRPFRPEFVVPDDVTIAHPLRRTTYRTTTVLESDGVIERPDGLRLFSRAMTWFDCVAEFNADHARRFTRHVLDVHCEPDELWSVVERWEARRRRRAHGRSHQLLTTLTGPRRPHRAVA